MDEAVRASPLLRRMGEILTGKAAELRDLVVAQTGSVGFITDAVQGAGPIAMFASNAALAEHTFRWVDTDAAHRRAHGMAGTAVVREPVGVVAAITPFNFPFMLNMVKSAPALAAGSPWCSSPTPGPRSTPS